MRNRFVIALALPLFFALAMGNLLAQAQAPEEDPTGSTGALKSQIQTGGSYDARSANGTRIVTDLKVPDALGAYGLDFTRYWNSLPNDYEDSLAEWPLDFGMSSWSHSWHWKAQYVTYSEPVGDDGEEEIFTTAIMITFPDGHTTKYKITRSNRPHGAPPPPPNLAGPPYTPGEIATWSYGGLGVHDNLCDMAVDGSQFRLCRSDGGSVRFIRHATLGYQAREVFDPHGLRTDLTYNSGGLLSKVEQEGGRFLTLTWSQFAGGWWAITRVDTGGVAGPQYVIYKYHKLNGYFLTLRSVTYQNDPTPGQSNTAYYTYGFDYGPGINNQSSFPLLKVADDPRYAGAMTKIAYEYSGVACPTPTPPPPWVYVPDYFHGQPSGIAAEKNPETNVEVSRFELPCLHQWRKETNGLGGWRMFYFGGDAGTQDLTVPPPDGPLFAGATNWAR